MQRTADEKVYLLLQELCSLMFVAVQIFYGVSVCPVYVASCLAMAMQFSSEEKSQG